MRDPFYTTEEISPRQRLTPEGFLICLGTALARTGEMIYGPGETPIRVGSDGIARVSRDENEVFSPETMASAEGKPVVNEHPEKDVTPETWKKLALGHVMNVRRGEGPEDDLLLGDLMITDPDAIELIREGKRELSCGYSCDYDELGPGRGRQRNIIINHVALVEQGRCGPRCSIGDHNPRRKAAMPQPTKGPSTFSRWKAAVLGHVMTGDNQSAVEMLKEGPARETSDSEHMKRRHEHDDDYGGGGGHEHHVHVHVPHGGGGMGRANEHDDDEGDEHGEGGEGHSMEAEVAKLKETVSGLAEAVSKIIGLLQGAGGGGNEEEEDDDEGEDEEEEEGMQDGDKRRRKPRDSDEPKEDKKIEGRLAEEAPPGSEENAKKAKDSAYLVDSFKETIALAEILAPGIKVPTFDRAAKPTKTYDTICKLRRQALELAYMQPSTRGMIDEVLNGKPLNLTQRTCDNVRTVFMAAAAMKRNANNLSGAGGATLSGFDPLAIPGGGVRTIDDLQRLNDEFYSKQKTS